ncbi:class I SAM-dependent methyltransferase [Candidatus Parcubacteria bacterium]|nr:class I SAM-dependent methyltransferase [Candidatus Parcubacteria bacterium]
MADIKEEVIKEFSSEITQKMYIKKAEAGLWGSEKFLVKKYFKPKSKILDIGCGTGRTTIPLFKLGYKVIGIDITPAMIKNAKKIATAKGFDIKYEVEDATQLQYDDNSFDNAIFSNNGWTQISGTENRIKALKEIYRILKSGGYYIFTAHTRKIKGLAIFWAKQWIKFYILKPLGFKIDEINFGDRFFKRESGGIRFNQKQYIHIPSIKEVKKQISEAGFDLAHMQRSKRVNIISTKDKIQLPPMFYVCRK